MPYKCCKYLRNGINFTRTGVRFCNKLASASESNVVDYGKGFYDKFIAYKKDMLENCRKGIVPDYCKNCMYLEEKDWDDISNYRINEIELFHWNMCNCACVYCGNRNETHLKITEKKSKSEFVELYPILKKLIKEKHLDDKVHVSCNGGEPTILKEYPDILKLFLKHNYQVQILTNGIIYEKLFAKALKTNLENDMTISIDCGSREMFRKVKGVDKFDNVTQNIARYIKDSGEGSKNLFIKYILIDGLNDNEEEIIKWLELCKKMGVKSLHPAIEFCHGIHDINKTGPSEHICNMYNFMKDKIVEYGFNLRVYDFVEIMVKNRSYR